MTTAQLHILQHSLGCDCFGRSEHRRRDEGDGCFGYYRNRFVTDPQSEDGKVCAELVRLEYMTDHGAQRLAGGMHCYTITEAGERAMRHESPAPLKLTRGQQRYRDYRKVADCFESFGAYLKYRQHRDRQERYV